MKKLVFLDSSVTFILGNDERELNKYWYWDRQAQLVNFPSNAIAYQVIRSFEVFLFYNLSKRLESEEEQKLIWLHFRYELQNTKVKNCSSVGGFKLNHTLSKEMIFEEFKEKVFEIPEAHAEAQSKSTPLTLA